MAWLYSMKQLANESRNCPVGWQGTESKCYRVSDDRMSYDKAQEFCDGLYGALATIENKNEAVLVEWPYFVSCKRVCIHQKPYQHDIFIGEP